MARSPDVIIIGAGIIGASIAWRLAQAGASVTLLDAGVLGGEASWAGAGMLAPGGEIAERTAWAQFALDSLAQYSRFVEELSAYAPIDHRACGSLEIARTAAEWADLQRRRAAQAALGIVARPADPPPGAAGALYYPDDALVDPRDVTRALRCACAAHQVQICEQRRVLEIRLTDRVEVETDAGPLSAAAGVLAAGAWSGEIPVTCRGERVPIPASFPVRGHLLGYRMAAGSLGPILRHGHTYVMQRSSGFTIAGTSSETVGFDRNLDPAVIAAIHTRACELLPGLRSAGEPQAWLGFRPATQDFELCLGRLNAFPLWLAYGHYRNGILLAPATAARVTRLIASWGTDSPAPGGSR
jgi:glycine oxidase